MFLLCCYWDEYNNIGDEVVDPQFILGSGPLCPTTSYYPFSLLIPMEYNPSPVDVVVKVLESWSWWVQVSLDLTLQFTELQNRYLVHPVKAVKGGWMWSWPHHSLACCWLWSWCAFTISLRWAIGLGDSDCKDPAMGHVLVQSCTSINVQGAATDLYWRSILDLEFWIYIGDLNSVFYFKCCFLLTQTTARSLFE